MITLSDTELDIVDRWKFKEGRYAVVLFDAINYDSDYVETCSNWVVGVYCWSEPKWKEFEVMIADRGFKTIQDLLQLDGFNKNDRCELWRKLCA